MQGHRDGEWHAHCYQHRRMTVPAPYELLLVAAALMVSCAAPGASVFDSSPELRPGATTWEAVQRAHSTPPASDTQLDTTLAHLLRQAVERDPRVRAAWHRWRAGVEAVASAGLPPRPQLTYTWLPLPVETRVGPNEHRVALQQRIPSPFRLVGQHRQAVAASESARFAHARASLQAAADLKALLGDVRYLQQGIRLVDGTTAIAQQLLDAARERFAEDRSTLFDVSKADAQLAQLRYDRQRFRELVEAAVGRLNALLDRHPNAELPQVAAWPLSGAAPALGVLYELALQHEPGMQGLDSQIRGRVARVAAARGALFPDITVGLQWMANAPAAMPGVEDSGQDALGVTVGISLPLWLGADLARVDSAEAALRATVEEKRTYLNRLLADVKEARLRLLNAHRLLVLYDRTLVPEARKALGDAEAWYREGVGGFSDFLEARGTVHRLLLARERAYADAVKAEAHLERLIGRPLPATEAL